MYELYGAGLVKFLVIADAFPPMRTSAAVIMNELVCELDKQGHEVTVLIPSPLSKASCEAKDYEHFKLILALTPKTNDVGYIRRTVAEFIAPYIIYYRLRSASIANENFDGIIWYSPSIFFGPLISRLKKRYGCPAYLVLRDMFPDWAVDLGLMKKRLPYYFFKFVEFYQYTVADHIGIQAPGNFKYFNNGILERFRSKVDVLWNWITPGDPNIPCSINLKKTQLAGRIIFAYAGNMGVAQDFDLIMNLVELYKDNREIGFIFVGRGSEVPRLKLFAEKHALSNIVFFDEIDSVEIPALYAQCSIGLVALDPRHKSNNIPGKFLSYIESGLPVLARLNPGNDLTQLISENQVGESYVGFDACDLKVAADALILSLKYDKEISFRCKSLAHSLFSTKTAAIQIVDALNCRV